MSWDIIIILVVWGCLQMVFSLVTSDVSAGDARIAWVAHIAAVAALLLCIFAPDVWADFTAPARLFVTKYFT